MHPARPSTSAHRPNGMVQSPSWRMLAFVVAGAVASLLAAGCGATSTTNVGPSPLKCEVSLSGASVVGPGGGSGTVMVSTQPECNWSATSQATWITRLTPRTGQGPGLIEFEAAANPVAGARQTEVVVNDIRIPIRQDVTLCSFDMNPTGISAQSPGGGQSIAVTATPGCSWTAASGANWIQVTAGASGAGAGTVTVQINGNNTGTARNGSLTVAGRTIPVAQSATGTCTYIVAPSTYSVAANGAASTVNVGTGSDCAWAASADASWLSITSPTLGAGSAAIAFTAATNPGPQRTGTLSIADRLVSVTQASGCVYALQSSSAAVDAGAASLSAAVTTNTGCTWTTSSNVSWITVSPGGTGAGSVALTVAANPSPARTGTVTIAGQTYSVTQAAGCTFGVVPNVVSVGSAASTASFTLSTGPGCAWTASSPTPWATINTPSGTGPVSVGFSAEANLGPARSGTVIIAGQFVTVSQASGCTIEISPQGSVTFGALGGSRAVAITTVEDCPWTAVSDADWIVLSQPPSGTGSRSIVLTVGPAFVRRTGSIVIGGQTLLVTQN